jgi:hypothetical protein
MAEQQSSYEFTAVTSQDILKDRQDAWEGFTQFATYGIAATVVVLVALAIFVV